MSYFGLLTHVCDIKRPTVTQDNAGSDNVVWNTVALGVACRIQKTKGDLIVATRGLDFDHEYLGFFEFGVDLQDGDKITWSNKDLVVLSIDDDSAGSGHHVEVIFGR